MQQKSCLLARCYFGQIRRQVLAWRWNWAGSNRLESLPLDWFPARFVVAFRRRRECVCRNRTIDVMQRRPSHTSGSESEWRPFRITGKLTGPVAKDVGRIIDCASRPSDSSQSVKNTSNPRLAVGRSGSPCSTMRGWHEDFEEKKPRPNRSNQ